VLSRPPPEGARSISSTPPSKTRRPGAGGSFSWPERPASARRELPRSSRPAPARGAFPCTRPGVARRRGPRTQRETLLSVECSGNPSCGWTGNFYYCGTAGGSDPSGEFPKECPFWSRADHRFRLAGGTCRFGAASQKGRGAVLGAALCRLLHPPAGQRTTVFGRSISGTHGVPRSLGPQE
jgi:hypothetical protein